MHKVFVVLLKDLLLRRSHWIITSFEILLPIGLIILMNLTTFPGVESPSTPLISDIIDKSCPYNNPDIFTKITYEPSNNFTRSLMSKVKCLGEFQDVRPGNVDAENADFKTGVKFKGLDNGVPKELNYELYPTSNFWSNPYQLWGDPMMEFYHYTSGPLKKLLRLIQAMDEGFLQLKNITTPMLTFKNTDTHPESTSNIYKILVVISFCLGFSLMIPGVVGRLVQQKSSGAKELMLIMGLKRWHLWVAKWLDCLIFFGLVQIIIVIFLHVPLTSTSSILKYVSSAWTLSYLIFASLGVLSFLFFLSSFFSNSTISVFVAQTIWGISLVIFVILSAYESKISRFVWLLSCLLPHICFFTGLSILLDFDYYQKPVNVWEILSRYPAYPALGHILIMIAIDIFLYSFLTWYLERILPGKYGIPQSIFFCFKKSYWFPKKSSFGVGQCPNRRENEENFEPVPDRLVPGISVFDLTKEYKSVTSGTVLAVDNINIDFYSGEISALLGHNGAGKTSVFSMIAGLIHPSSGRVIIDGYNITLETDKARESIGLCPQQDMLFEDLTPEQILYFFGIIKGLTKSEASAEAKMYIEKLKLNEVRNTKAGQLSGGQKRKVSLAIALIGGSRVLLLDEPTSGLDPEIRREMWEILLEMRGTRTILLTTHFMEEADAISDRIAIMDHGKVKCYGTPMYLKTKFGSGYLLSVVVQCEDKADDASELVKTHVQSAKLKSQNGLTLTFQLPQEEVETFPNLLLALDNLQISSQIHSYSISFSTFEEVFIRLKEIEDETDSVIKISNRPPYQRLEYENGIKRSELNFILLYFYQLYALLIKKGIYFYRNIFSYAYMSVRKNALAGRSKTMFFNHVATLFQDLPIIIVFLQLIVLPPSDPTLSKDVKYNSGNGIFFYSPHSYGGSIILYSSSPNNKLSKDFDDYVTGHGLRAHKVDNVVEEIKNMFFNDYHVYGRELLMGAEFDDASNKINVYFNSHAIHVLPVSINMLYNSFLVSNKSGDTIKTSVNLKYSHREKNELVFLSRSPGIESRCTICNIVDSIGIQTIFYIRGPIKENQFNAKHLQLMSTSVVMYWISHMLFDIVTLIAFLLVIFMIYWYSGLDDIFVNNTADIILAFILWGIGLILIAYVLSTIMNNLAVACSICLTINCLFTFLVFNFVHWNMWPKELLYLHPSSMLKIELYNMGSLENDHSNTKLLLYDIILFVCLVLIDSRILPNISHWLLSIIYRVKFPIMAEKDPAVFTHEEMVRGILNRKEFSLNSLVVDAIKRWYLNGIRPRPAVRGISFAVNKGECFGLLGVNGAGKTTSFKILTGEVVPSHGEAYVNGYRLFSLTKGCKAQRQIGYCPQSGGFIPTLKGRELMSLFLRLRGYYGSHVTKETSRLIDESGLLSYDDTVVENYSGGNQRKLAVALAIAGGTSVLLFDEPTSGVDPVSRRCIWKVLTNLRKEGKSVLLTSHSMDECESVCTRLAIMVKGYFRCYGEVTTLKELFGHGYTVQLKINTDVTSDEVKSIKSAMTEQFGSGCALTDEHLTFLEYHITNKNLKWHTLFTNLIGMKREFKSLESFHASATTLEQIFIYFARNQQF